ncbi:MAG: polysaccharide biosynthesis protein [Ruminococcaceae bacterium]|nr:polysaccharide biosynthesis protein [Oscillospiraceae bacterium]
MARTKKQSFFGGAAILAAGIAIVKVIGAVFAIPLFNIVGDAGAADFNNAYNIYSMLLMISTAGLPVALSKMVSEANTLGRERQARRIFRVSFSAFLTLGLLSFFVMWFGNKWCAGLLHNPNAAYGIRVLAPAVVCVGCLAAFRGYAQGNMRMTPTAVGQIMEALCKLVIGLALAKHFIDAGRGESIAAAGAIAGVTIGTVLALVYMIFDYFLHRSRPRSHDHPDESGVILRRLIGIAVPITISASMVSVITLIDTSLVQGQLQNALGYSLDETRKLYGTYSAVMKLYNLPASLMVALTASVIPTLSGSLAARDRAQTARVTNASLRVTALLAFPMGLGLWSLAEPITRLCYPKYDVKLGGELLAVLGIASLFVCLTLISNSILQAHNAVKVPILSMFLGGVVKIVLNYNLAAVESVNIHAAPIGTLVCFAISTVVNLFFVWLIVRDKPNFFALFTKPLAASLLMAACAKGTYALMHLAVDSNRLCVAVSVAGAVVVYFVLVLALRIISRDELMLLPKGQKLARLLRVK